GGGGIVLGAAGRVRALRLPYRSAFVTDVAVPDDGEAVEILNVHLSAPHIPPFGRRIRQRRGQLREIFAHLDATPRRWRVLVGDPNATPHLPAYPRPPAPLPAAALPAPPPLGRAPRRPRGPRARP